MDKDFRKLRRRRAQPDLLEGPELIPFERIEDNIEEIWEELHCRSSISSSSNNNETLSHHPSSGWEPAESPFLPEDGLDSPTSIATSVSLLAPTLSAVGIDFCSDETDFPFQHFLYVEEAEGTSTASTIKTTLALHEQLTPGWYVNCCNMPQQPKDDDTDFPTFAPSKQNIFNPSPTTTGSPTFRLTLAPTILATINSSSAAITNSTSDGLRDNERAAAAGQIFVSSVAVLLSFLTMLAMTLPLLNKRRRSRASTYNLYLVFLAIPDFAYNIFLVWLFANFERYTCRDGRDFFLGLGGCEGYDNPDQLPVVDHPYDLALFALCASSTLYMNAIIAYEILKLLRNSKRRRRSKAPTLKKASLQALLAYTIGTVIFMLDNYCKDPLFELGKTVETITKIVMVIITIAIPIGYLLWVCFRIWYEGLLGDVRTKAGKRLSVLIRYFSRIIVVYIFIWVPAAILYTFHFYSANPGLQYLQACIIYSLSAWVSFGLSLTKPDVRKNFRLLLTFRYCRSKGPRNDDKEPGTQFYSKHRSDEEEANRTTSTGEETFGNKLICEKLCCDEKDTECNTTDRSRRSVVEEEGMERDEIVDSKFKEEMNRSHDVFDFAGADARRERAKVSPKFKAEMNDSNVFDFAGADAPRERTDSDDDILGLGGITKTIKKPWGMLSERVGTPKMLGGLLSDRTQKEKAKTQKTKFRRHSSGSFESQSMRLSVSDSKMQARKSLHASHGSLGHNSFSEPFDTSFAHDDDEFKARHSVSTSRKSNRSSLSNSKQLKPTPEDSYNGSYASFAISEATTSSQFKGSKKTLAAEFLMERQALDRDTSDKSTSERSTSEKSTFDGTSSGMASRQYQSSHLRDSEKSNTMDFFMDRSSTMSSFSSQPGGVDFKPKSLSRWMKDLRKNIRDLKQQLMKANVSEEQKTTYRQSIMHHEMALEVASSLKTGSSKTNNLDDTNGSADSKERSMAFSLADRNRISMFFQSTDLETVESGSSDDDYDDGDANEISYYGKRLSESGDNDNQWRYSTQHWLSELRININELSDRLENENTTEEEKILVQRAIDSQKATLQSMTGVRSSLYGASNRSPQTSPLSSRVLVSRSVEHPANSAYSSSLPVIHDSSEVDSP